MAESVPAGVPGRADAEGAMDRRRRLNAAQRALHILLGDGSGAWPEVYELIDCVRERGLYRPDFRSFTAWMKALADREGVSTSLLWRRKRAGDFYRAWASMHPAAPELGKTPNLSVDGLDTIRKISQIDAARADELMYELIDRGLSPKRLRAELRERELHRRRMERR